MYKKVLKKDDYAKHSGCNKCTVVTKKWAFCFIPNFKENIFITLIKKSLEFIVAGGKFCRITNKQGNINVVLSNKTSCENK